MHKRSKITNFFKSENIKTGDNNLDTEKAGKDIGNQVKKNLNTDDSKTDRTEERSFFDKPNQPVIYFPKMF